MSLTHCLVTYNDTFQVRIILKLFNLFKNQEQKKRHMKQVKNDFDPKF